MDHKTWKTSVHLRHEKQIVEKGVSLLCCARSMEPGGRGWKGVVMGETGTFYGSVRIQQPLQSSVVLQPSKQRDLECLFWNNPGRNMPCLYLMTVFAASWTLIIGNSWDKSFHCLFFFCNLKKEKRQKGQQYNRTTKNSKNDPKAIKSTPISTVYQSLEQLSWNDLWPHSPCFCDITLSCHGNHFLLPQTKSSWSISNSTRQLTEKGWKKQNSELLLPKW